MLTGRRLRGRPRGDELGVTDFLVKGRLDARCSSARSATRSATTQTLASCARAGALRARGPGRQRRDLGLGPASRGDDLLLPRWKAMLGYADDEIGELARGVVRARPPRGRRARCARRSTPTSRAQTPHFESEHRIRHADGELPLGAQPRRRDPRRRRAADRMAGSMSDITDRKGAEEQLLHDALPRRADRAAQPRAVPRPPRRCRLTRARSATPATAARCCSSTSTASSSSTTASATRSATSCSMALAPAPQDARCAPATPSRGSAATSSRSCSTTSTRPTSAVEVAERIQRTLARAVQIDGRDLFVTASIGIAVSEPDSEPRRADARRRHRDVRRQAPAATRRSAVFDASMHSRVVGRAAARDRAARGDRAASGCAVFYQPIVDLETGRLRGFEALARWPATPSARSRPTSSSRSPRRPA